jgi:hypothetical protein
MMEYFEIGLLLSERAFSPNLCGSRMQITFLDKAPPNLRRNQSVFAIRAVDASMEFAMLDSLASMAGAGLPILPALLQPPAVGGGATPLSEDDPRLREAREMVESYGLNDDQATALRSTAGWFASGASQARPPFLFEFMGWQLGHLGVSQREECLVGGREGRKGNSKSQGCIQRVLNFCANFLMSLLALNLSSPSAKTAVRCQRQAHVCQVGESP